MTFQLYNVAISGMRKIILIFILIIPVGIQSQVTIEGEVKNSNEETVEFASVFLIGSEYASVSDKEGKYLLENVLPGAYQLKVTFLGYKDVIQEIVVKDEDLLLPITLLGNVYELEEVEIISNRVEEDEAFTFTQVSEEELEVLNNGQDLPFALRYTPSAVVTSDAGAGIGYTGIRLRGSDATRINVTINGIPLNDSESQGVFWVDLPDIVSSVDNIQIQRGVGSSTNGVGAFGGTISLNTFKTYLNSYASVDLGYGSYDSRRLSLKLGTGLINDHYSIDARYSLISSDGYIDRASSDLKSMYFSASRVDEKGSLRFLVFSGDEITYQSWYGTPEARVNNDRNQLTTHYNNNKGSLYFGKQDSINLFNSDRKYNYYQYENQVDDYRQTHMQLHSFRKMSDDVLWNTSLFYTKGKGFFEQFKVDQNLGDYGIESTLSSDLVRRRWLDNDYFGFTSNVNFNASDKTKYIAGLGVSKYIGGHYGRVINVAEQVTFDKGNNYYFNEGNKSDVNGFIKANLAIGQKMSLTADFQLRHIEYDIFGTDNDGINIDISESLTFINPKLGLNYRLNNSNQVYISYAIGNKEPGRSDYIDNETSPEAERLYDLELGYKYHTPRFNGELVFYNMSYKNQLVLTGALNDVGSALRANVEHSYRRGVEWSMAADITEKLSFMGNLTFSQNKINKFNDVLYDYTNGFEEIITTIENTDISFSPSSIIGGVVDYKLTQNVNLGYRIKHVGAQFLDNTGNEDRQLSAYTVSDLTFQVTPRLKFAKRAKVIFEARNVFNVLYASNGYTYSYIYGEPITENFLYPQAERNFMVTIGIDF